MKLHRMRKLVAIGIAAIGAAVATPLIVVPALATPASGEHPTLLAKAQFGEIKAKAIDGAWKAEIETEGVSDLHVVKVTIDPGGTLGWHSHPGPRFLIVTSGTATNYLADDPHLHSPDDSGRIGLVRTSRRGAQPSERNQRTA
jgi:hypothetical protein